MNRQYFIISTIVALCFLGLSLAEEEQEIYDTVFAQGGGIPTEPVETLELLERLKKLYSARKNDEGSVANLAKVEALITDGLVTKGKCDSSSFMRRQSSIEQNSAYSVNIVPYLKICRNQQLSLCKQLVGDPLKEAVNKITRKQRFDMDLLKSRIFIANTEVDPTTLNFRIPSQNLVKGLLSYVQFMAGGSIPDRIKKYKQVFTETVQALCVPIKTAIEPFLFIFDEEEEQSDGDKFTQEWLTNEKICRDILDEMDELADRTFRAATSDSSTANSVKKLLQSAGRKLTLNAPN